MSKTCQTSFRGVSLSKPSWQGAKNYTSMNKTPAPNGTCQTSTCLISSAVCRSQLAVGSLPSCRGHIKATVYRHVEDKFVFEERVVDAPAYSVLIIVKIYEYNRIVAFRYPIFYA